MDVWTFHQSPVHLVALVRWSLMAVGCFNRPGINLSETTITSICCYKSIHPPSNPSYIPLPAISLTIYLSTVLLPGGSVSKNIFLVGRRRYLIRRMQEIWILNRIASGVFELLRISRTVVRCKRTISKKFFFAISINLNWFYLQDCLFLLFFFLFYSL